MRLCKQNKEEIYRAIREAYDVHGTFLNDEEESPEGSDSGPLH